jgi:heat shock protein HtpX
MGLKTRMFLLVGILFGILYGIIVAVGSALGVGGTLAYLLLALGFLGFQYIISPTIVGWTMHVKWVTEKEEPELHQIVADLAREAHLPKPKVGVSQLNMPNAFAFGRTQHDGRVCVTKGILKLLNKDELRAVLGHEMSHIKNRDMAVITLLSAVPMILYWIAMTTIYGGFLGNRKNVGGYTAIIGIGAFVMYFITNLLVLYGSRIREYAADKGSVDLGSRPNFLATALYKLTNTGSMLRNSKEVKQTQGASAFFISNPSQSWDEVREIVQIDQNRDGIIDQNDLLALQQKKIRLNSGERILEIFTTHPNTIKRIQQLSAYLS